MSAAKTELIEQIDRHWRRGEHAKAQAAQAKLAKLRGNA